MRVRIWLVGVALAACAAPPSPSPSPSPSTQSELGASCGDGVCAATESAVSCPQDCWGQRGCFADASTRTLPAYFGDNFTVESCRARVAADGRYQFFGVQYYGQCFGGATLPTTPLPDSACNTPCSQNPAEGCGGAWANAVYATTPIDTVRIDAPNVRQRVTEYPGIRFAPGDRVHVTAGGCVQTGGSGTTWKRYVNPSGGSADALYHGRIWIPGATMGLEPVGSLVDPRRGDAVVAALPAGADPGELFLRLGYDDNDYGDNGYGSHDGGTENQCAGADGGNAWVSLTTVHGGAPAPRACTPSSVNLPMDLYWDALDPNLLPLNPRWGAQCGSPSLLPDQNSLCGTCTGGVCVATFAAGLPGQLGAACTSFHLTDETNAVPYAPPLCNSMMNGGNTDVNGHLNWGFATYTGRVFWDGYSDPIAFADHDFNLRLRPDAYPAGLLANNGEVAPGAGRGLQIEFTRDETLAIWSSPTLPAAWQRFADGDDAVRAQLINNRPAIALGLIGTDTVHPVATEIHPTLALAIQVKAPDRGDAEEVWMIMARRYGSEGECSDTTYGHLHAFDGHQVRFRLPTSFASPVLGAGGFDLRDRRGARSGLPFSVTATGDGAVTLALTNADPDDVVLGELHLVAAAGAAVCGDHACTGLETCSTCQADCCTGPQGLTCGLTYVGAGDGTCRGYPTTHFPIAPGFTKVTTDGDWGASASAGFWHQELLDGATDPALSTAFALPKGASCGFHHTRNSPGRTCMGYNPARAFGLEPDGGGLAGCPAGWTAKRAFDQSSDTGWWVWCEYQDPARRAGGAQVGDGVACGVGMNAATGQTQGQCLDQPVDRGGAPACPAGLTASTGWFDSGRSSGHGLGFCATTTTPLPAVCGDGMCNGGESCASCGSDCGPCPPAGCGALLAGEGLLAGQSVRSCDGRATLVMQTDGNLVLYGPAGALWSSWTFEVGAYALMQPDGNLVVYAPGGRAVWSAGTYGHAGAWLAIQTDGNLVIYQGAAVLWSTGTSIPPACGDGVCNGAETCASCAADCGACPPPPTDCTTTGCPSGKVCCECGAEPYCTTALICRKCGG